MTDDEWALIAPQIPPAKHRGRRRSVDVCDLVNGLLYVLSPGCQWRYVPKDFLPNTTLFVYFDLWTYHGVIDRIHHALYVQCREKVERDASLSACLIDSQSVKSVEEWWGYRIMAIYCESDTL